MSNILLLSRQGWFVRLIINIFYLLNNLIISILIPISKIPLIIFYENRVYSLAINYLHSYLQYLKGCTFEELTINVLGRTIFCSNKGEDEVNNTTTQRTFPHGHNSRQSRHSAEQ